MSAIKAKINPAVLVWARNFVNASQEDIATQFKKKSVTKETIDSWEKGKDYPTLHDVKKMANMYGVHYVVFYLPMPPKKIKPIKDFRATIYHYSKGLILLLRELQNKQEWTSEYKQSIGEPPLPFVGKMNVNNTVTEAVQIIKKYFNFNINWDRKCNYNKIIKNIIVEMEQKGIFVSQGSGVNPQNTITPEEVRGLAISDKYAPFIFINSKDYQSAKIFSLIHELVHILLNESGVSDISYANQDRIEVFCNMVAAEFLVPKETFISEWRILQDQIEDKVNALALYFKVSRTVVLIRAKTLSLVDDISFTDMRKKFREEHMQKKEEKNTAITHGDFSGPSPYLLKSILNGKTFSHLVLDAYSKSNLLLRDVYFLLKVKANNIDKYVEKGHLFR